MTLLAYILLSMPLTLTRLLEQYYSSCLGLSLRLYLAVDVAWLSYLTTNFSARLQEYRGLCLTFDRAPSIEVQYHGERTCLAMTTRDTHIQDRTCWSVFAPCPKTSLKKVPTPAGPQYGLSILSCN